MLDSRAPPIQIDEEEIQREQATEREIRRLLHQTRLWRAANSAQWVAWGIVQAKVPGIDEALETMMDTTPRSTDTITQSPQPLSEPSDPSLTISNADVDNELPKSKDAETADTQDEDEEEGFDYLGYAQERAMLFWGDVIQLGILKETDLPPELLKKVKIIDY